MPEKTANLWLTWEPVSAVRVGAGMRYVDTRFTDDASTKLPAYTVFDASVHWNISDNLALTLRGRNLTDERDYVLSQYGANKWIFGDPRAYDISFHYTL